MKIRFLSTWIVLLSLAILLAAPFRDVVSAPVETPADLVILHAKIYTENPRQPWAEAVAISAGKIVAVGLDDEIASYRGSRTKVIDAGGRVVLPGFTDSHIHFLEGALSLDWLDLNGARSVPEIETRLKQYASSHRGNRWVFGQGWSYDAFGIAALPDKLILDRLFPNRPVYLESFDGHSAWVNSKALALAGISRRTADPPGGKIVRVAQTGEPAGALIEDARHLVKAIVPQPPNAEKIAALRKGLAMAGEYGLVRLHAAGEPPDTFGDFYNTDLFDQLRQMGQLTARFYISKDIQPPEMAQADLVALEQARGKYHDEWISVGAAKFFLDGVIESHSAAMLAPYSDAPGNAGTTQWAPEKYALAVGNLDRHGFQIFTHAIGDRAVRIALDAYERAGKLNGTVDPRHRVEHIEVISEEDIPRFASIGVIASMQPLHAYPEEGVWGLHVGPARDKYGFAWNSLLKAGAHLAFGSDWEVVTMNPWPGVRTAVTRQDDKGWPAGGWVPEQRISVAQAIAAYTLGAAYAGHRELTEGSLEPGKLADLIIVSQNPFEVDPHELGKTQVMTTVVGGRVIYQRPNSPGRPIN
ncbi:MAG: amidohydrolase [Candidatus Acidiferrales bacterium]